MVFDKTSSRTWNGGLTSTASGKGYNTLVRSDGNMLNFEPDFDQIDEDYAKICDVLAERRSLIGLDDRFRFRLADVVAVQLLRTPIVRSTLEALPRDLLEQMRAPGDSELPDDNAVRQSTRDLIAGRARQRQSLLAKDLILFEPAGAARFWTSDNPVARHSNTPLGDTGLESLGVEIYLPISPDLMLGFLCPSLREMPVTGIDKKTSRSFSTEEVLRAGVPLKVTVPVVNFFNSLQIHSSQRFLYAANDDFDLARKLLQLHPELSSNDRLFQMGKMGEAPPRPSDLPPGEWLYLETDRGYLTIPIRNYRHEGLSREMSTERLDLLLMASALGPFIRAEIFANSGGGGMRCAEIQIIDAGPPVRFRLAFADSSLQALDAAIARHSGKA